MVKEHTKVELCIFCLMSVSIGLKIASKVLNIKHFSGQLIIKVLFRVSPRAGVRVRVWYKACRNIVCEQKPTCEKLLKTILLIKDKSHLSVCYVC